MIKNQIKITFNEHLQNIKTIQQTIIEIGKILYNGRTSTLQQFAFGIGWLRTSFRICFCSFTKSTQKNFPDAIEYDPHHCSAKH